MGGGRDEQSVYPFYKVNIHEVIPTMFLRTSSCILQNAWVCRRGRLHM